MVEPVNIFITTATPRAVRVAEVNRHPCVLGDFSIYRYLTALIVGRAHGQRHAIERSAKALYY